MEDKTSSLLGYFSLSKRGDFIDYTTVLSYMGGDNRKGRRSYRHKGVKSALGSLNRKALVWEVKAITTITCLLSLGISMHAAGLLL